METPSRYDLFISYAHADDTGGTISALVEEIKVRQQRIDGQPMRIFFDREGIQGMDDWELRILTALRQSRVMIAVLSPAYFESDYCRKEWAWFVDRETERAMTGEAIAPVYTLTVDDFEPSPEAIPDDWPRNLKRRQYLDARPWWDEGAASKKAEATTPSTTTMRRGDRNFQTGPNSLNAFAPSAMPLSLWRRPTVPIQGHAPAQVRCK